MTHEEKLMRDMCNEYGIPWVENAKAPMINGYPIHNLDLQRLLSDPNYLSECSED